MLKSLYLSLSVYFFLSWLIIPPMLVMVAYFGSKRRGTRFYSTRDLVAVLLLFSAGSFALFAELLVSGGFAQFLSPSALVVGPYVSPSEIFMVTLPTYALLFAVFVLISAGAGRKGSA